MQEFRVSVIVIVHNAENLLKTCLDSLMELDFSRNDLEIIVVDNNSTDCSKNIILQYPVVYLFEENLGRGWARNKGVRHALGKFVAFTDADCIVRKDWLSKLVAGFDDNENLAICGGKIIAFKQETIFEKYVEARGILSQKKAIEGQNPDDLPRVVTANAIFRRRVLEEAGYFDEDLVTSEDTELSWRISFLGYEMKYIPEAVVYHQHTRTFRKFWKHHFDFGKAAVGVNQKYRGIHLGIDGRPTVIKFIPLIIRAFFILTWRTITGVISGIGTQSMLFLIFDTIISISYNCGSLAAIYQITFSKKNQTFSSRIPLERFYRALTVKHNGIQWSLNRPAAWFPNNDLLRLVVFYDGLHTYGFNKSATRIWLSLIDTRDFESTVSDISRNYGMSENIIRQDTSALMTMLEEEKVLKRFTVEQN